MDHVGLKLVVAFSFSFFSFYIVKLFLSFMTSFIRIIMCIWRERFGSGEHDFILVRWVEPCAKFIRSCFTSTEVEDEWVDVIKTLLLIVVLCGIVGAPLLYVASVYGYFAIIDVLCVILVICEWQKCGAHDSFLVQVRHP